MALLDKIAFWRSGPNTPLDPHWARSASGHFHRLIRLDPEKEGLSRIAGVFVVWHSGIRPEWVYVGQTEDLAGTFHHLAANRDIMSYEVNGGLYVSWCLIKDEYCAGVARYLHDTLHPLVENAALAAMDVTPLPVIAPRRADAGR